MGHLGRLGHAFPLIALTRAHMRPMAKACPKRPKCPKPGCTHTSSVFAGVRLKYPHRLVGLGSRLNG
jgi:hypothetical protein